MAFNLKAFSRVVTSERGSGRKSCLYLYSTDDPAAVVQASGYFDPAVRANSIGKGDVVNASCAVSGATPARLDVVVTAVVNGAITVAVVSGGVATDPPVNTTLPTIVGVAAVAQPLTLNFGAFSNNPTGINWSLRRNGTAISGANGTATPGVAGTYTPVAADAGAVLELAVAGVNVSGTGAAVTSNPTKVVAPAVKVEELLAYAPSLTGANLTTPVVWTLEGTPVPGLVPSSSGAAGFATKAGTYNNVTLKATGANGVVKSFTHDVVVTAGKVGQYFFALDRGRPATQNGSVVAGKEHTRHTFNFYSPPYKSNSFRCGMPGHWTNALGTTPSEANLANSYTVDGFALHAWLSGAWVKVQGAVNGATSFAVDPGVGKLSDNVVFPQDLPANTPMRGIFAITAPLNGKVPTCFPNRNTPDPVTGASEGAVGSASVVFGNTVLDDNPPTGQGDGRMSGLYAPEFIVAKAIDGIDRPVVWGLGDSIAWSKNGLENQLMLGNYGLFGFLSMGLGDDTRSRRIMHYNCSVPGVSGTEWTDRTTWAGKLDLIRLVPNRPYTRIITEHNNNGGLLGTDANYPTTGRTQVHSYLTTVINESTYWGDTSPPIYATRPLPRPTVWPYSVAVQTPSGTPYPAAAKWQYDDDLVAGSVFTELAGVIDIARDYRLDSGNGRDKIKVPSFATTLSADTAVATTIQTQAAPSIGDYLLVNFGQSNQQGRHVTGVTGTSAPYTVQLDSNMTAGIVAGSPVQAILAGDSQGLHPATPGHKLIAEPLIDWKIATWG